MLRLLAMISSYSYCPPSRDCLRRITELKQIERHQLGVKHIDATTTRLHARRVNVATRVPCTLRPEQQGEGELTLSERGKQSRTSRKSPENERCERREPDTRHASVNRM